MAVATHTIRATVRIHVGTYRKELDLSLPATSSVGECVDEIIDFTGAPRITRPWRVSTAAGRRIDPTVAVRDTALVDGSVVVLSPEEHAPAPVIRGAAEALATDAAEAAPRGIPVTWSVIGAMCAAAVIHAAAPLPVALVAVGALTGAIGVWCRRRIDPTPLSIVATVAMVLAAAYWVADDVAPSLSLVCAAMALAGGFALFLGHLARLHGPRTTAAVLTCVVMAALAALGALMPGPTSALGTTRAPATASASMVLAAALITVTIAPGLTSRAAGLKVPQLPTAGEDLGVADTPPDDAGDNAARALKLYSGVTLGLTFACLPACAALAFAGSGVRFPLGWAGLPGDSVEPLVGTHADGAGFAQALLYIISGAMALHAARHREPVAEWALNALTASAAGAACLAAWVRWAEWPAGAGSSAGTEHPWVMLAVAAILAVCALTVPLWAHAVPSLEPTTVRWAERAESLAVAACLPLAAHLLGLFVLLRGLG
ncbi:hypothetical protein CMASS_01885 [Corynebacterium massiliense DSM 45435]|uniref:Type VII secretion integral membrane protein EccD n=1 Tax=Corynebacterium massiliense DSM 45435 TaxID=1121364 RepID=A0ABY7U576_9CORY|nr:hypothetical protein CMASS_01885 [Corynebacterium massiliense DSM 45435]